MTGMMGTTTGTTAGAMTAPPDDEEELREDELAPPPPEPLKRELTDAVDAAMADARREPKPGVVVAVANRLSSHSEI